MAKENPKKGEEAPKEEKGKPQEAPKKGEPQETSTTSITLTVEPGPLSKVALDTTEVALTPGEGHTFAVEAFDQEVSSKGA